MGRRRGFSTSSSPDREALPIGFSVLLKTRCLPGIIVALTIQFAASAASAAVIYRGLQNIAIPTNFTGVYLNIDNGATDSVEFTGWDINPFFGGVGVGNSPAFQPARSNTANSDPIVALGVGTTVDSGLLFSTGYGGSENHLGAGSDRFGSGQEAYLGFRFMTDGNAGPLFGWMRVVFTANTPGGVIKDWAYETSGALIRTGNVLQAAPAAGVSVVTLSGGLGENFTLGSVTANVGGGNTIGIAKTGAGTWTLAGPQTYSSLSINEGITNLNVSLSGATINSSGGTLNFNVNQTLAALSIGAGGVVALSGAVSALAFEEVEPVAGSSTQTVPEPGRTALLIGALLLLLSRTRHRKLPLTVGTNGAT